MCVYMTFEHLKFKCVCVTGFKDLVFFLVFVSFNNFSYCMLSVGADS